MASPFIMPLPLVPEITVRLTSLKIFGVISAVLYEYIMAADVYTTGLLDKTGIDGHERPKKRQVFQITNEKIRE